MQKLTDLALSSEDSKTAAQNLFEYQKSFAIIGSSRANNQLETSLFKSLDAVSNTSAEEFIQILTAEDLCPYHHDGCEVGNAALFLKYLDSNPERLDFFIKNSTSDALLLYTKRKFLQLHQKLKLHPYNIDTNDAYNTHIAIVLDRVRTLDGASNEIKDEILLTTINSVFYGLKLPQLNDNNPLHESREAVIKNSLQITLLHLIQQLNTKPPKILDMLYFIMYQPSSQSDMALKIASDLIANKIDIVEKNATGEPIAVLLPIKPIGDYAATYKFIRDALINSSPVNFKLLCETLKQAVEYNNKGAMRALLEVARSNEDWNFIEFTISLLENDQISSSAFESYLKINNMSVYDFMCSIQGQEFQLKLIKLLLARDSLFLQESRRKYGVLYLLAGNRNLCSEFLIYLLDTKIKEDSRYCDLSKAFIKEDLNTSPLEVAAKMGNVDFVLLVVKLICRRIPENEKQSKDRVIKAINDMQNAGIDITQIIDKLTEANAKLSIWQRASSTSSEILYALAPKQYDAMFLSFTNMFGSRSSSHAEATTHFNSKDHHRLKPT